jgi:hypothetical protein
MSQRLRCISPYIIPIDEFNFSDCNYTILLNTYSQTMKDDISEIGVVNKHQMSKYPIDQSLFDFDLYIYHFFFERVIVV